MPYTTTPTRDEVRVIEAGPPVETRDDGNAPRLTGYAALFGQETVIGEWFRERIEPGAFSAALERQDDVRALINHDPTLILGRTRSGTLTLTQDERGLRYEVLPPDTTYARDLLASVQRGDVTQSSFAFRVTRERQEPPTQRGQLPLRIVQEVELFDVSPVTYPAYANTTVSARAVQAAALVLADPLTTARLRVQLLEVE